LIQSASNYFTLPFLITKFTGSNPTSYLSSAFFFVSFKVNSHHPSDHAHLHPMQVYIIQRFHQPNPAAKYHTTTHAQLMCFAFQYSIS